MASNRSNIERRPRGKRLLPGVGRIARKLRVTRQHLMLVIKGERVGSAKLLKNLARELEKKAKTKKSNGR